MFVLEHDSSGIAAEGAIAECINLVLLRGTPLIGEVYLHFKPSFLSLDHSFHPVKSLTKIICCKSFDLLFRDERVTNILVGTHKIHKTGVSTPCSKAKSNEFQDKTPSHNRRIFLANMSHNLSSYGGLILSQNE